MDEIKINKVQIRNLQIEDYDQLAQSFTRVYSDGSDVFWTHKQIEKLIRIFPEGQIVTVVDEKIVGCALSIIVNYDDVKNDHTYAQVTGKETFNTHNPKGNILYGIEVFIHPQYRGLRLARRMYEYRKEICETLNLKAIMFGGRIPNYHKYADQLRPKEYIDKVKQKEIYDPVLTFQLSNDFHVRKVMRNYLPNDEESKHYACLLQWDNIYYQAPTQEYVSPKTTVRVGLVQWQMRTYKTLDDLFEQVEFFVDAVSDYKSDFVLFPEYFNAPLMAKFNDEGESEAIRGLAAYTNEIRERFVKLAISYNINIITGSMPLIKEEDGRLYNVGFLCRRDGTYEMYEKIHVTPDEIKSWGLSGGKSLQTFDTDCAKIGVLICYDVEFPELSRIMADQGMQILFVPFLTDTQNAYSR
ncbi:MAG: GNAT family N-acetyltransferase, partial [Bacteroides stercoris]|nr:GNAT family N-acetyltransferase [Bacteroides stercoris]